MKKIDQPTMIKKTYESMKVTFVGKLNNVVQKSGDFSDNSTNYTTKDFDNGRGNG